MAGNDQNQVIIIKLNPQCKEVWRYTGRLLSQSEDSLLVEAFFNRTDLPFHDILLKHNDRFLERYFSRRWYNIFEIHDRDDDHLKGWYCNITQPAEFSPGQITYVDLALDLLVYPDLTYLVLDDDEFDNLSIDQQTREEATTALEALISLVESGRIRNLFKI